MLRRRHLSLLNPAFYLLPFVALVCLPINSWAQSKASDAINFNRDIRPLLSDRCFHCHGPDESNREGDLRLDLEKTAKASVIVAGMPDASELLARIASVDDLRMPPPELGKGFTKSEVDLIRRWIEQGAEWQEHWSFVAPQRPAIPNVQRAQWANNEIDFFVLKKLEELGLEPSMPASRRTLARRVALDLTGLPPTAEQLNTFLNDSSEDAYRILIHSLLESTHYGERMAFDWLDAARYSDTDGFQADATRKNWPWRDWVIDAFNNNMPFDQFTIEQFAGDLLPESTSDQILATCFHRNHMTNGEGGRDPAESRIDYVIDRVNTTGTVWLGLTLGCCQCHTHKYDPISHNEYYQLNAFFNNIDEDGKAGRDARPYHQATPKYVDAGIAESEAWLDSVQAKLKEIESDAMRGFDDWISARANDLKEVDSFSSWTPTRAITASSATKNAIEQDEHLHFHVSGPNPKFDDYVLAIDTNKKRVSGIRLRILPQVSSPLEPLKKGRLSLADDGHIVLTNVKVYIRDAATNEDREIEISTTIADYETETSGRNYGFLKDVLDDDPRTGWTTQGSDATEARTAVFGFAEPVSVASGETLYVELRQRSLVGYSNLRHFMVELTDELGPAIATTSPTPLEIFSSKQRDVTKLDDDELKSLHEQFFAGIAKVQEARIAVKKAKARLEDYRKSNKPIDVMVLKERTEKRDTHVLIRGEWDKKGDTVEPDTPQALSTWPDNAPKNRLGLAKWLVDKKNPLTARVIVNRFWQIYFGAGLVRTPDDFGTQGEMPSHPELLDWLAVEFMESGWNVKHLQELIVSSATYQQSSVTTPQLQALDPENRWLARASRFRMPSWMIRDAALASSGLLNRRIGGPPVYPYQPPGAWADSTMGRFHYEPSVGKDVYRRSIYAFWRRSVAPTGMFDAAKRRVCEVRVVRTNTPLHALTLMNDTTYVEAARGLAQGAIESHDQIEGQISAIVSRVLLRPPGDDERSILTKQYRVTLEHFRGHWSSVEELLSTGQLPANSQLDPSQLAAMSMVASTILNLDEAITRE